MKASCMPRNSQRDAGPEFEKHLKREGETLTIDILVAGVLYNFCFSCCANHCRCPGDHICKKATAIMDAVKGE